MNSSLRELLFDELQHYVESGGVGGFLPAVKQIANVAALPGIVGKSIGLPDVHSGYGFAIGNVAAFDMDNPVSVVSPGGVGFDINCGVRLVRTNLFESDIAPVKEQLTQALFDHIPVGVGSKGIIPTTSADLEAALEMGMDWSLREGYAWAEDKEHCFAPDTRVLMADGSSRAIGECAVGDALVDEQGAACTVSRISRGEGQLYQVTYGSKQQQQDQEGCSGSFVCNGGHQLVLFVPSHVSVCEAGDGSSVAVSYRSLMQLEGGCRLPASVPATVTKEFLVDELAAASVQSNSPSSSSSAAQVVYASASQARAAAKAFAAGLPTHLLWEPTVTQYRAFTAAYPNRQQWCTMLRAAPAGLPNAPACAAYVDFTVTAAGHGEYVSLEVATVAHRFLLADYLLVHNCEEYGRMLTADPSKVTKRAKKRGLPQLGTLGAGNHYAEVQVVDEIYDKVAARRMGIEAEGQVCVMIHSGSRGLGHQVATDALVDMEAAMSKYGITPNDRQLACAPISSPEGQDYLKAMSAAANYAWVNRSSMTFLTRQAFAKVFQSSPDDLDMHVIYDVSHNIAKVEEHLVDGRPKKLLVHRKGATRAFGPHHPLIPVDYQFTGQPVLIGGTMGTCSYVLTGTDKGMEETMGSTCHGAGRASSRAKSRRTLTYEDVLDALAAKGISIRVASPKLVMEEAPESYKDVSAVVDTCHEAGISNKAIKLRPIAVVKG